MLLFRYLTPTFLINFIANSFQILQNDLYYTAYSKCIRLLDYNCFQLSCHRHLHAMLQHWKRDATGRKTDSGCVKEPRGLECLWQVRNSAFCSFVCSLHTKAVCSLQRRCGMQTSWELRRRKEEKRKRSLGWAGRRLKKRKKNWCKDFKKRELGKCFRGSNVDRHC